MHGPIETHRPQMSSPRHGEMVGYGGEQGEVYSASFLVFESRMAGSVRWVSWVNICFS